MKTKLLRSWQAVGAYVATAIIMFWLTCGKCHGGELSGAIVIDTSHSYNSDRVIILLEMIKKEIEELNKKEGILLKMLDEEKHGVKK